MRDEGNLAHPVGIAGIEVLSLFGRYDYKIDFTKHDNSEFSRLSLLYGDNGTGKTTILRLLFHLLSLEGHRDHLSHIARTPFQRFRISFANGYTVQAAKTKTRLTGSYKVTLTAPGETDITASIEADTDTGSVGRSSARRHLMRIASIVSEFNVDVLYLADTRDLEGDTAPKGERRQYLNRRFWEPSELERYSERYRLHSREHERSESNLIESIRRTEQWLKTETIRASSIGETDARQSYAHILQTIATAEAPVGVALHMQVSRLESELRELERTSSEFAEFGLGSTLEAGFLAESLASAHEIRLPVIVQVLQSFLDGQRAKLDALREIYKKMDRFVEIANAYLWDKTVRLHVYDGFTIRSPDQELDPDNLSSGEKHLLLLLLNVFTSSDRSPLFIIDEPELSLNIKWQRKLVSSLLELSENTNCQFLMATHSIELLTKHRDYVVHLMSAR